MNWTNKTAFEQEMDLQWKFLAPHMEIEWVDSLVYYKDQYISIQGEINMNEWINQSTNQLFKT